MAMNKNILQKELSGIQKDLELYSKAIDDTGWLDVEKMKNTIKKLKMLITNTEALRSVFAMRDDLMINGRNDLQLLQTMVSSELALFSPDWALWAQNGYSLTFMEVKNAGTVPSVTNLVTFEFQPSTNIQNIIFLCISKESGIHFKFCVQPCELVKTVHALLKSFQSAVVITKKTLGQMPEVPKMEELVTKCDKNMSMDISGYLPVKSEDTLIDGPANTLVADKNFCQSVRNLSIVKSDPQEGIRTLHALPSEIHSHVTRKEITESMMKHVPKVPKQDRNSKGNDMALIESVSDNAFNNKFDPSKGLNTLLEREASCKENSVYDCELDLMKEDALSMKQYSDIFDDDCPKSDMNYNVTRIISKTKIDELIWQSQLHKKTKREKNSYVKQKNIKKKINVKKQNSEQSFVCQECGFKTNCKSYLKAHFMRMHECKKDRTCPECGKIMKAHNLKIHMMRVHDKGDDTYQCSVCPFSTKWQTGLRIHIRKEHAGNLEECSKCGFKTKNKANLRAHIRRIHEPHSFPCDRCDKCFKTSDKMQRHVLAVHENQREYSCIICEKAFQHKDKLIRHQNGVHLGNRFPCSQCKADFSQKGDLYRHVSKCH